MTQPSQFPQSPEPVSQVPRQAMKADNEGNNSIIKILFLSADPTEASRLKLGRELQHIRERLQLSQFRDNFSLESRESVRPGDISQAIFDVKPQIVHFAGHGTSTGELCFEDILGKIHPVQPDALAAFFKLLNEQVNCIVLNACYSKIQATAIVQHIPYVIGMNKAITDEAAIAFAVGFYKALGANRTIEKAFDFGCVELQLLGITEQLTPVLLKKKNKRKVAKKSSSTSNLIQVAQENTSVSLAEHNTAQSIPVLTIETIEPKATRKLATFVLSGTIDSIDEIKLKAIFEHLQKIARNAGENVELTILNVEEGSIKITLGGSPEGLKWLEEVFKSGELMEVLGIPVEDVQLRDVTTEEYKSRVVQALINQKFIGKDLSNFDLSGVQLSGLDLRGANLRGANLRGADLRGANLSDADLRGANLRGADLRGANLSRADLRSADLRSANLSRADLSRADLSDADLSDADLSDADLSDADLSDANLSDADLRGADLRDANLRGADLRDADLSNANLFVANLRDANLRDANLSRAYLRGAKIDERTQIDSKWCLVWEIVNQEASGRNLSSADLSSADLRGAILRGAILSSADLRGADLRGADLRGADLSYSNLSYFNLSYSNLSYSNLSYSNLSEADLSRANLSRAELSDATVVNALFGGSEGLTEDMRRDLKRRGAIFGDRPPVLAPH